MFEGTSNSREFFHKELGVEESALSERQLDVDFVVESEVLADFETTSRMSQRLIGFVFFPFLKTQCAVMSG